MKTYPCGHSSRMEKPRERCQTCYMRIWRVSPSGKKWNQKWLSKNQDLLRKRNHEGRVSRGKEYYRIAAKKYNAKLKLEVIAAYGGHCVCCKESTPEFLQVDHIHGSGRKHTRQPGVGMGSMFYRWLRKQGFPKDNFRLLCANCNHAVRMGRTCPHEVARRRALFQFVVNE